MRNPRELVPGSVALIAALLATWSAPAAAPRNDAAVECIANGTSPLWSSDGSRLAYLSDSATPGARQIFVTDPGDCAPQQVTSLGGPVGTYSWSPDGTRFVLSGKVSPSVEDDILIVEIATGALLQCTNTSTDTDSDPVWSPDGSTIIYSTEYSHGGGFFETHKLDPADCLPAPPGGYEPSMCLTCFDGTFDTQATWSHDGNTIAYIHHPGFNSSGDLRLMDPNGGNVRTCAPSLPFIWRGNAFSPDDSILVQNLGGGGGRQIVRVDPIACDPNAPPVPVTDPNEGFDERIAEYNRSQSWFPSGHAIAYQTNRDGNYEIYAVDPEDPSYRVRLTSDPSDDTNPVVSPRAVVAFECDAGGQTGICLLGPGASVTASHRNPAEGSRITACVHLDTSFAGEALGSYGATLAWDPGVLQYVQSTGGDAPFDSPSINEADVSSGLLGFADADAGGAIGGVDVLCAEFDVVGAAGTGSSLDLEVTSLFAAGSFLELGSISSAIDDSISVVLECTVGDVIPDGVINSGDALVVLSYEVMLPIPAAYEERIAARCGDVNGDGATNSVDALILLSYEIGLPIDPGFPIGGSNQTFDSCPGAPGTSLPQGGVAGAGTESIVASSEPIVAFLDTAIRRVRPGEEFTIALRVDMGGAGERLGSYGARLDWNPRVMELVSVAGGGPGSFPAPVVNAARVRRGTVRMAQAYPTGAQGLVDIAVMSFRAKRSLRNPAGAVEVSFSSLGSTSPDFAELLGRLEVEKFRTRLPSRR